MVRATPPVSIQTVGPIDRDISKLRGMAHEFIPNMTAMQGVADRIQKRAPTDDVETVTATVSRILGQARYNGMSANIAMMLARVNTGKYGEAVPAFRGAWEFFKSMPEIEQKAALQYFSDAAGIMLQLGLVSIKPSEGAANAPSAP